MSKRTSIHRSRLFPALHTLVASGALVAVPACVAEDAPPDLAAFDDLDLTPISPAGDQWNDCSTWDCNKNHPELTGFPVPELHEGGEPTDDGFHIVNFRKGPTTYQLDVAGGEIRGIHTGGGLPLLGADVINSIITVTNGTRTWYIRINAYTNMLQYWAGTGYVPAYHLVYWRNDPIEPGWVNVCNDPPAVTLDPQWQGGHETYALLIDDERYNREEIAVEEDDADAQGWFNIACAGTALAKMVLLHADPKIPEGTSTTPSPYYTTKAQRTATLKMLTADYFGKGYSFTEPHQDLWWLSTMGWHSLVPPQNNSNHEAIWNENGARCLNTPRLHNHPTVDVYVAMEAYIAGTDFDPIPSCDEVPPGPQPGDVWHSYNTW